jgi:Pentapeptide repeats (8 copies)
MDAFHRLSRFGRTVKERAWSIWRSALLGCLYRLLGLFPKFERGLRWLKPRRRMALWTVGTSIVVVVLLIGWGGAIWSRSGEMWNWWTGKQSPSEAISPLLTLAAGVAVAGVALVRHFAQTDADRQRRITESFSKAVEQLSSDKIEVRLGGIYSLERISKESRDDYWTVMETLTAFLRERARRKAPMPWTMASLYETEEPTSPRGRATDIAAVLTVIKRRDKANYQRDHSFNLSLTALEEADLTGAKLHHATLTHADLTHVRVTGIAAMLTVLGRRDKAHHQLDLGFDLSDITAENADLIGADLTEADLTEANLTDALLVGAKLTGARLTFADLTGAKLRHATLTRAKLTGARGLTQAQLDAASGTNTVLPDGLTIKPEKPDDAPKAP